MAEKDISIDKELKEILKKPDKDLKGTLKNDIDDMEMDIDNSVSDADDVLEKFVQMFKQFLSNENIEQKSRISNKQLEFLVKAHSLNDFLEEKYSIWTIEKGTHRKKYIFRFRNRVLDYYCWHIIEKVISLDGKGRQEIIDFFKPIMAGFNAENPHVSQIEYKR